MSTCEAKSAMMCTLAPSPTQISTSEQCSRDHEPSWSADTWGGSHHKRHGRRGARLSPGTAPRYGEQRLHSERRSWSDLGTSPWPCGACPCHSFGGLRAHSFRLLPAMKSEGFSEPKTATSPSTTPPPSSATRLLPFLRCSTRRQEFLQQLDHLQAGLQDFHLTHVDNEHLKPHLTLLEGTSKWGSGGGGSAAQAAPYLHDSHARIVKPVTGNMLAPCQSRSCGVAPARKKMAPSPLGPAWAPGTRKYA